MTQQKGQVCPSARGWSVHVVDLLFPSHWWWMIFSLFPHRRPSTAFPLCLCRTFKTLQPMSNLQAFLMSWCLSVSSSFKPLFSFKLPSSHLKPPSNHFKEQAFQEGYFKATFTAVVLAGNSTTALLSLLWTQTRNMHPAHRIWPHSESVCQYVNSLTDIGPLQAPHPIWVQDPVWSTWIFSYAPLASNVEVLITEAECTGRSVSCSLGLVVGHCTTYAVHKYPVYSFYGIVNIPVNLM
jgi:hypothetical protein